MVLVKMLMEIDPLPMRGSMVMMMVTLMKTITTAMIPLPMALQCHKERGGEVLPLVLPPPWPPPRWGEVLPLVLGLHGDDGPLRLPLPWPPVMMPPSSRVS